MPRDPRTDPQPGDRILYGPQWQSEAAEVVNRFGDEVNYRVTNSKDPIATPIANWRKWMEGAEVLHVAEEKEKP